MKIEIEKIVTVDGKEVKRITTLDERWYENKGKYVPSVTWITSYYPKGIGYYKWLANKGWDEAEEIKNLAGERGSKIHNAIDMLIKGEELKIDQMFPNHNAGTMEELTPDEWAAVMSFKDWNDFAKPVYIQNEYAVINETLNYAGTIDIKCRIGDKLYIIDVKTSQYIWPAHEIQLSAYKHADKDEKDLNVGIVQVGYKLNKRNWKFSEIEDQFELFKSVIPIWAKDNKDKQPLQKDYPLSIKL